MELGNRGSLRGAPRTGAHLVVFAVGVAAAAGRRDAAPAVEHEARVALAALHAVVAAVALEADGGAARLAHAHAALVVAVRRAGDGCNRTQGRAQTVTEPEPLREVEDAPLSPSPPLCFGGASSYDRLNNGPTSRGPLEVPP